MIKALGTCGKRSTDPMIWESILYYYGSIVMNKYNLRKNSGSPFIKYYSIIFASSGIGKSYSVKRVEKLWNLDNYSDIMMSYYNTGVALLPDQPSEVAEIRRYMPKSITIGTEGTSEGLWQVAQSQKASGFGSLNLSTEEFTEYISNSAGLLSKLKELYDCTLKSKIIKGDHDSEIKGDIQDLIVNFIGLGSKKAANKEAKEELKRIASSGLYRRTFIIDSKTIVKKNREPEKIDDLKQYFHELNETFKHDFIERRKTNLMSERYLDLGPEYMEAVDQIDDKLIEKANSSQLDEFAQYDTGSLEIIESLAHIIAFLEWDTTVTKSHLDKAFNFFSRTRETVADTFKSLHPYKTMYDLLKKKDNMTISEMAEIESDIPISKQKVEDNIALLEELCYRNDEILFRNEGKVTRFRIEELPMNKLDKLIFSVHNEGDKEYAINFKPIELTWEQLPKLVISEKVESFTTAHFQPTKAAPDGHREAKSYIEGANVIAFDIDEEMTIAEAEELLSEYTYMIYTSKSHNTEKYDYCDRFRILLPTKNKFYVTPDQHKQLYINIEEFLGLHNNDVQTRNVSRLWYTNKGGTLFENKGTLLDVRFLLPNTDKSDDYIPKMNQITTEEEEGTLSKREAGYIKWFMINASEGNRNASLFNAYKFFTDIGSDDPGSRIIRLNSMLLKPLPDSEINQITRSANK